MDTEELREKIVECSNKDLYIKDLNEQIEEMKTQINQLKNEKNDLCTEKNDMEKKLRTQQNLLSKEHLKVNIKLNELKEELNQTQIICKNFESCNFDHIFLSIKHYQKLFDVEKEQNCQKEKQLQQEIVNLKEIQKHEIDSYKNKLNEKEAKIKLLEENFKELNVLTEMQMKEKVHEVENIWKVKLEAQELESEAILKECQAISEYNIIQSEIEKNSFKNKFEEIKKSFEPLEERNKLLETEKRAYQLSITTFRETIEVLKNRLFDSDHDVVQLKEELEKCEEKIIYYEQKCSDLMNQLSETQISKEELEMQYESTSKIMQDEVKDVKRDLLEKVKALTDKSKQISNDRDLLIEIREQYREQQILVKEAQKTISEAEVWFNIMESKQLDLETRLEKEIEDSAEIRKKYIDKSGKYDELAQQFEQLLQELDDSKSRLQKLDNLLVSTQAEMEKHKQDKEEISQKYAEVLGHQNHKQKLKHLNSLKIKSTELFQKNIDLETTNRQLNKTVEKMKFELDNLKKPTMKLEDKENISSPKFLKGTQSPRALKEIN